MARKCPKCESGNVYILVSGKLVCRTCGFDERKEVTKMKSGKNDEAVSPVVGVILLVAITVILAAIMAAFVFGMAGNTTSGKVVAITAHTNPDGTVELMNMGGKDIATLTGIRITGNVTVEGPLGINLGDIETFTLSGPIGSNRIKAIGTFGDGTEQILLNTIV